MPSIWIQGDVVLFASNNDSFLELRWILSKSRCCCFYRRYRFFVTILDVSFLPIALVFCAENGLNYKGTLWLHMKSSYKRNTASLPALFSVLKG